MKLRGFEIITAYKEKKHHLASTCHHHAAGYDFEAAENRGAKHLESRRDRRVKRFCERDQNS